MNKIEKDYKKELVKIALEPLLRQKNFQIIKVEYVVTDNDDEYIILTFCRVNQKKPCVTQKKICVTGYTIGQMINDCLYEI